MNQSNEIVVVDAVAVPRRPRKLLLRKALWANTWLLLSLAVASKRLFAASAVNSVNVDAQGNAYIESQELEVSEDYDMSHETSWATDNLFDKEHDEDEKGIIVVATIDGSIAGLSRQTGHVVWKQTGISLIESDLPSSNDTNNGDSSKVLSPLVSTTTTKSSSHDWRTAAVPSVDGRVFLTAGRDAELTATSTLQELVARAPFVDARGRFYVGSRQATAAAMDRDTGEILRVVSGADVSQEPSDLLEGRNIVWVGRVDYSISLFDARSGIMDVKFSSSEIMGVQDMVVDDIENPGAQQHAPRLMLPTKVANKQLAMLISTPNGNVALRNSDTGAIEWVSNETFDTPVAFALEASSGASLSVDILPDAPLPDRSPEYLASQLERQIDLITASEEPEQTIVGALSSGQLFAMPLGKRLSQARHSISIGLSHSTTTSSSAVGSKTISSKVPNLGKKSGSGSHPQKADEHSRTSALAKKTCGPSSPNFPACLVGGIHHNHDFTSGAGGSFLDSYGTSNPTALLPFQQMHSMQNDLMELQQFRKNKRNFFKLMESWLPPTMALIFVLSLELGRRIKATKRREQESALRLTQSTESIGTMSNSGVRSIGVIQVTDDVLGFGGHGTVVYRGTLDGRQVAVKRMLKAYHASADREISLLIESDGHPNVVRYFLKEVTGDFVYLALELCDMSLHDLIVKLRQYTQAASPLLQPQLMGVTKATLYQIACGVRHLHSLRIVHRDLKPANILLAMTGRTKGKTGLVNDRLIDDDEMLSLYEKGGYVAKISDMGLGKQLTGQSSFGLSTLGNASMQGSVNGRESSRLTCAGPGSVGWQAPEVMAIRWSAETPSVSAKSGESNSRTDSFMEASPVDAAMNSRTSRSVDIFSLGCIFHCTLVPGIHPFGEWYEREANIMRNRVSTDELFDLSPDAYDLITAMICRDATERPTAKEVCEHPFFWSPQQKLAFLCEISDRIEIDSQLVEEGKEPSSRFCANVFAIERNAAQIVGTAWDQALDPDLVSNVSKFRTYDPSSVRDCLRLIRNKHHHYDELPHSVKEKVGSNPDGLLTYFESRFPRLLLHCYKMSKDFMEANDPLGLKYSIGSTRNSKRRIEKRSSTGVLCDDSFNSSSILVADSALAIPEESQSNDGLESQGGMHEASIASCYIQDEVEGMSQDTVGIGNDVCADDTGSFKIALDDDSAHPSSNAFTIPTQDIVIWEGSTASKTFKCRGWLRADDEWIRRVDSSSNKLDSNLTRCAADAKFRTRLCNHWDSSLGTFCPMQKRNKCIFAHGPVELRVKEGKKTRWGKLVDVNGNNSNPKHSGGEDTYGAARSIETIRKEEGKWSTDKAIPAKVKAKAKQLPVRKSQQEVGIL